MVCVLILIHRERNAVCRRKPEITSDSKSAEIVRLQKLIVGRINKQTWHFILSSKAYNYTLHLMKEIYFVDSGHQEICLHSQDSMEREES